MMRSVRLSGPRSAIDARVHVPASKSLSNRALIMCAVAGGGSIAGPLDCEDTRLLARALAQAGWPLCWDSSIEIGGRIVPDGEIRVDLGNSGTGARLLLSLLACVSGTTVIDGSLRLRQRPMQPLVGALKELGATIEASSGGALPIRVAGQRLRGGIVTLRPGASSQFVTSLVIAAPLMKNGLDLKLEGPIPSRPYLDLTESVMNDFGAELVRHNDGRRWRVIPGKIERRSYSVEGDWSAAAFFLAAIAVAGGRVEIGPLNAESRQGDRVMCEILERAGMLMSFQGECLIAEGPVRRPIEADLRDSPDLFPALAVVASCAPPGSKLTGLEFLRHKESDRLSVMVENLEKLGAGCHAGGHDFSVSRSLNTVEPGVGVTAASDHRIAMAMAVAALRVGPLELDDEQCVEKSFPSFWQEWKEVVAGG